MSEVTVTMPKKEYDELVEFKKIISKGDIRARYSTYHGMGSFTSSSSSFNYSALPEVIEEINSKINLQNKEELRKEFRREIKKLEKERDEFININQILRDCIEENKLPKWWRFW